MNKLETTRKGNDLKIVAKVSFFIPNLILKRFQVRPTASARYLKDNLYTINPEQTLDIFWNNNFNRVSRFRYI